MTRYELRWHQRLAIVSPALLVFVALACSTLQPKAPPNLTPQATVAFYGTYAIKDLDHVRDFVSDGHNLTPPMFSAKTTLAVVTWHESAIRAIHAAPQGWKVAVLKSIDELQNDIPPAEYAKLRPYLAFAKVEITEVP